MGRYNNNQDELLDRLIEDMRYGAYEAERDGVEYDKEAEADRLQAHIDKLQSVGSVYGRTDSIITQENIEVRVEDNAEMDTTAYNDGKSIVFNARLLEEVDDRTIISLNGFNYHEVAHILYSPRGGSEFGKTIKHEGLKHAFNVLEDSRIERLLIAKYPSVAPFLEASCLEYLLKGDASEFHNYFPLFTGRKYIDLDLRQRIADGFIKAHGKELAMAISLITHEYRTLVYPRDYDRGLELIRKFAEIVGRDDEVNQRGCLPQGGGGHTDRDVMDKGRVKGAKEQEAQGNTATQNESGLSNNKEQLDNPSSGNGDTDPADTDGEKHDPSRSFSPDGKDDADNTNLIKDQINNRLDTLLRDENVLRDTQTTRKAIQSNAERRSAIKQGAYSNQRVPASAQASAHNFGVTLERIRIDNDPAWELEQPMGRLNIGRAMRADINDINKVFDRWHEGNSNNDIDAVILVDSSGSMGWQMERTMESAWIIKRGIERINGRVSVYKFNHNSRLIYSADDKAMPTEYRYVNSSGGTNPYKALMEARRILTASRRGVRLLFIVTDGSWDMTEQNNDVISHLNTEGVETAVVYLGDLRRWCESYNSDGTISFDREQYDRYVKEYRHNAKVFRAVTEPSDLVLIAKDLVRVTMGKRH